MTKREELELFLERCDELVDSKYIIADVKLANLLKSVACSETLLALFKNCLADFDYYGAQKKYFVKNPHMSSDKGEFVLPPNSRELLAFIFTTLVELDSKHIDLGEFLIKYFYVDGSYSASYDAFITSMVKPFKNTVKMLMDSVIDGKLQDPIEALNEEEQRREKEKKDRDLKERHERELLKKAYGASVKVLKEILLVDKKKAKTSKMSEKAKKETVLVIDMLANVLESEDKDAIEYAFIAYKYVAKAHPIVLFRRISKVEKLLKDLTNAF